MPDVSFCIVIPMYDEEQNAERCVRALVKAIAPLPYRSGLIVVNDGSTDGTGSILQRLKPEFDRLIVVTHEFNSGYGCAVKTGMMQAQSNGFDYALFMDSDLTNDPKYIPDFVRKMEGKFDMIKASRYMEGGGMVGVPSHRALISVIGNRIVRWLMGLPLSDLTNGFRAVRVDILSEMPLTEPGFAVIMEELYHLKFLAKTFCEIPYILTSRGQGKGLSKFTYRPKIFWDYLKYALKAGLGIRPTVSEGGMLDAKGPQAFR